MAKIIPFKAIRPTRDKAYLVSSKPSYTYKKNLLEAKLESNPYTFLHVINPEFREDHKTAPNSVERFQHVKDKFNEFCHDNIFIQDKTESIYIYRQITPTHTHLGIIAGVAVDDYINGHIKIHEHTITQREETFKTYLEVCKFNAEPVLLTYKDKTSINNLINKYIQHRPEYEFNTTQEIKHDLWLVNNKEDINSLIKEFEAIEKVYIADGHHRSASSVLYAKSKREQIKNYHPNSNFNYFLAYFIAESNLNIIEYNRIIKGLNGISPESFLDKIAEKFEVEEKKQGVTPTQPHHFSMYLNNNWYLLKAKPVIIDENDIIESLDTQIMFKNVIDPILGISNSKTDNRIDFIDGTMGPEGLKNAVDSGKSDIAFGFYPVSIEQLKAIADTNNIMPPKSTYIEPKLRSGLIIYDLEE